MRPPSGKARWHRERVLVPIAALACSVWALCSIPRPALAVYDPLEEIPVESPIYSDLESLALRFGAPGFFVSRRPWTRGEALEYLSDLRLRKGGAEGDPSFLRIEREVSPNAPGARPPGWTLNDEDRRLEVSPYAVALYQEDPSRRPTVNRDYRLGAQASARAATRLLIFGDMYAGTASQGGHGTPNFGTKFAIAEGVDFNAWLDRAYLALEGADAPHRIRATLAHSWVRWGPGATGTLGVSDAAPALDRLGFDIGILRGLEISWFVSSLDPVEQLYYAASRMSIRLGEGLELGVAEEARFDGTDQLFYYLIPAFPYTFIEKRVDAFTAATDTTNKFKKNNVMASVDFSWSVTRGFRWYGEFLLDDYSIASTFKPKQIGWQTGLHAARALNGHRIASVRAEYTRIYDFVYTVWHGHDFEFAGRPLGYVLGPDAEQAWTEARLDWSVPWTATIHAARVRKGEGSIGQPWDPALGKVDNVPLSGVVERTWSASAGIAFRPSAGLSLEGRVGYSDISNAEHAPGADRQHVTGSIDVQARW
ncbi:MAG: capsule assembly Wzi family protein [Candidatus Eisenbacteria bacterium]|uniref:Capsule assembly Wzi family protein n=1 Tax=Eiseniibacteriota bacterium TaxID=2212470 RepID=A0A538TAM4_UNCEI|nr:MAG: capsule assembly Wzi family protein [Candidatus Eisenbacteria bacterium]